MSKLELCFGTSVLLIFFYFYFEQKKVNLNLRMDEFLEERGLSMTWDNYSEIDDLIKNDPEFSQLANLFDESRWNSRLSLFFSLGLLFWCLTL
jgi:hypothetical protein